MRLYQTLREAALEIRRDIYKSTPLEVSRVQQRVEIGSKAKERIGLDYGIEASGFPVTAEELVTLGKELGLKGYQGEASDLVYWLERERDIRCGYEEDWSDQSHDKHHPALKSTEEGNWFSYTYQERLRGAVGVLAQTIVKSPDTRRAYWPIFYPHDSLRAIAPTRVPCSLGYEVLMREVNGVPKLMLVYLQRSMDFDTFWLSDIWLANQFQQAVLEKVRENWWPAQQPEMGHTMHYVISAHSFTAVDQEIY